MDFKIKVRRNKDKAVVFEMSGKLSTGEPVLLLREFLKTELQNGAKHILLDLSAVSSVDSRGLGEMVASMTTVTSKGGSLNISGLNKGSTDMIQMTGLEPVFNSRSPISPHLRNTLWKNLGIAFAVIVVGTAFYWIALR